MMSNETHVSAKEAFEQVRHEMQWHSKKARHCDDNHARAARRLFGALCMVAQFAEDGELDCDTDELKGDDLHTDFKARIKSSIGNVRCS